jgi:hypothetical protein
MRNREAAKHGGVMPAQSGHGGSAMGKEVKERERPNVRFDFFPSCQGGPGFRFRTPTSKIDSGQSD